MNIKANIKIGNSVFSIEPTEGKFKDQMFEIAEIINTMEKTPKKCDLCGSEDISWGAMEVEGKTDKTKGKKFKYIKRVCNKCGATSTMGERNADGMLYWRSDELGNMWSKYQK